MNYSEVDNSKWKERKAQSMENDPKAAFNEFYVIYANERYAWTYFQDN